MYIEKGAKVKVLVLGDSGVGKSSLTHLLCHNEANKNPGYTIGCSIEIKLHDYKVGTPAEQTYCLEIWDIGASNSHTSSRFIFYSGVNGIIMVHDLTNRKSLQNLNKWMNEVINQDPNLSGVTVGSGNVSSYDSAQNYGTFSIPVIMVGTKLDLIDDSKRRDIARRSAMVADDFGCSEIYLDSAQSQFLAPGSGNAVKLTRFFDKVVEDAKQKRVTSRGDLTPQRSERRGSFSGSDRRRFPASKMGGFTPTKSGHQD